MRRLMQHSNQMRGSVGILSKIVSTVAKVADSRVQFGAQCYSMRDSF